MTSISDAEWERLKAIARKCRGDLDRFNSVVLGRGDYWSRQIEICQSLNDFPITCVKAGNGVGKTFLAAGVLLGFTFCHPGSKAVIAAPSREQLSGVLWPEVEAAYAGSRVPLGGRIKHLHVQLGEKWEARGFGAVTKVERMSGHHARDLLLIAEEASGISGTVHEAIDSLNPSRRLYIGNPLKAEGKFYDLCEKSASNPAVNVITIPSLESPHIHMQRSPHGMADAPWLDQCRHDWGEDSIWWASHVLARFPNEGEDALIPRAWLDLAAATIHRRDGPTRLAIDLAKGNGGDRTVLMVRDDNGLLHGESSSEWPLEEAARRARLLTERFEIAPHRVSFDAGGLGTDFGNRLVAVGLQSARAYLGGNAGGRKFYNLRAAAGWTARQRLDPKRMTQTPSGVSVPQAPFAIPRPLAEALRPELCALRYELVKAEQIALEDGKSFRERLKHSPDLADCFGQLFAFPG